MKLGIRARFERASNGIKARIGFGEYWYWLSDDEAGPEIPIAPLVYPLRYDILIRKQFFDFYVANRDAYFTNRGSFVRLAREHIYFTWFTKVLVRRYGTGGHASEDFLAAQYRERIENSVALYESVKAYGFDPNRPIIPFSGKKILPADSGKTVRQPYFMGDGCHRLACLISMGYTSLPRGYFRVKCFSSLQPFDNTALLEKEIPIAWPPSMIPETRK